MTEDREDGVPTEDEDLDDESDYGDEPEVNVKERDTSNIFKSWWLKHVTGCTLVAQNFAC